MFGKIHLYSGDGKGKTTAALGLAIRAAGRGYKVFFGQFLKDGQSGEVSILARYAEYQSFGRKGFPCLTGSPEEIDYKLALKGLDTIKEKALSGRYDLVVADEINFAIKCGLVTHFEVLTLLKSDLKSELVLTGRDPHPEIIKASDLVTEMKLVKHYFNDQVPARDGIEK